MQICFRDNLLYGENFWIEAGLTLGDTAERKALH